MDSPAASPPDPPRRRLGGRLLAMAGIQRDPGRRLGFRLRLRFYLFAFLLLAATALTGGAVYSTHPSFCRSCHIMEPYYRDWANSRHRNVACVECHYPPGEPRTVLWKKFQALSQVAKFVTRTYSSKPYAEVEDSSCLRSGCHSTRLLQGRVVSQKGVLFDHRPHLEGVRYGRQLRCVSCHSQVVVGKHIEVTWDSCFLCHLKGHKEGRNIEPLGGCLGCHVLPDREIKAGNVTYNHKNFLKESRPVPCQSCHQDVVQGDGRVNPDRCVICHNQPEKLSRIDDIPFLHDNHVTKHNTACFHCHDEIRHKSSSAGTKPMSLECNLCHAHLHESQRSFYMGIGARGVDPMPSPMYLANVDCVGCHLDEKADARDPNGKTFSGTERGCTNCHGKEYEGTLMKTSAAVQGAVQAVSTKLAAVRQGLPGDAAKDPEAAREKAELEDAAHNVAYIVTSHSVHNAYYAAEILRRADEVLSRISKRHKIDVRPGSENPVISGAFCATLCHPSFGVKVPPEKVVYQGKEMPHGDHAGEMACTKCHVFGAHKDVRVKGNLKCTACHEEDEEKKK